MNTHITPDSFYKLKLPVKIWHNWKNKCWRLLDSKNTIIADNLTKELAETLEQAVNVCGPALAFIKFFIEWEDIVIDRKDAAYNDIVYRNAMYNQAMMFLVKLDIMPPPPKYHDALPEWREILMDNIHRTVLDNEFENVANVEDGFIDLYKRIGGTVKNDSNNE